MTNKNPVRIDKRTPLHIAVENGHIEIVKYIMDVIDDKNQNDLKGQTPMHLAVQKGDYEIFKVIIDRGC